MRQLLIASIDPGTTIGYAAIDMGGNPILLGSSRHLAKDELITALIEKGKPIIIATDKQDVPQLVHDIAAQVGAMVFSPKEDLLQAVKQEMTQVHNVGNDHERDALAAALVAYQKYKPLFQKVERIVDEHDADAVKHYVVTHPGANIRLAWDIVRQPEEKRLQRIAEQRQTKQDVQHLYARIKELEDQNFLLRQQKTDLFERLRRAERLLHRAGRPEKPVKTGSEEAIRRALDREKQRALSYRRDLQLLHKIISEGDYMLVKKLPSLGFTKELSSVKENDVLLIEDPASYSQKAIDLLREKVHILLHKKPVPKNIRLPFSFIPADRLALLELGHSAFVKRDAYLAEKAKLDLFDATVRTYQEERKRFFARHHPIA
ncbi:DUF460 domain-containing protein [Candidatus Woesearchaeota archaeon]|nr:DUF460 domain-containing protein [Candidatus Woesearchaeota archaeon]